MSVLFSTCSYLYEHNAAPPMLRRPIRSPTPPVLYTFPNPDEVSKSLAEFVINAQNEAVNKRDKFKLAISGGSLAATLAKHLVGNDRVKWDKW